MRRPPLFRGRQVEGEQPRRAVAGRGPGLGLARLTPRVGDGRVHAVDRQDQGADRPRVDAALAGVADDVGHQPVGLDRDRVEFGEVADAESRAVVDAIAAVSTDRSDRPLTDVVIQRVEIEN